jgi:hypothetical protein
VAVGWLAVLLVCLHVWPATMRLRRSAVFHDPCSHDTYWAAVWCPAQPCIAPYSRCVKHPPGNVLGRATPGIDLPVPVMLVAVCACLQQCAASGTRVSGSVYSLLWPGWPTHGHPICAGTLYVFLAHPLHSTGQVFLSTDMLGHSALDLASPSAWSCPEAVCTCLVNFWPRLQMSCGPPSGGQAVGLSLFLCVKDIM